MVINALNAGTSTFMADFEGKRLVVWSGGLHTLDSSTLYFRFQCSYLG
jgi:hypothetical protein